MKGLQAGASVLLFCVLAFSASAGDNGITLRDAVRANDLTKVQEILKMPDTDVNSQSNHGETALHIAASRGLLEVAKLLLASGARLDVKDEDGNTPLELSIKKGNTAIWNLLIKKKNSSTPHAADSSGPSNLPQHGEAKTAETWTKDWSQFVEKLSEEVAKDKTFIRNVNSAFIGKRVEWVGKVKEIQRPGTGNTRATAHIELSMKPEELQMNPGSVILDSMRIFPNGEEWKTWSPVSVGSRVLFSTTLSEWVLPPKCVLTVMTGMGRNEGKVMAWINTKGGSCQKVLGDDEK